MDADVGAEAGRRVTARCRRPETKSSLQHKKPELTRRVDFGFFVTWEDLKRDPRRAGARISAHGRARQGIEAGRRVTAQCRRPETKSSLQHQIILYIVKDYLFTPRNNPAILNCNHLYSQKDIFGIVRRHMIWIENNQFLRYRSYLNSKPILLSA